MIIKTLPSPIRMFKPARRISWAKGLGSARYLLVNNERPEMLMIKLGDWPEFAWYDVWFIELGSPIC